jgi:hypothetical protein
MASLYRVMEKRAGKQSCICSLKAGMTDTIPLAEYTPTALTLRLPRFTRQSLSRGAWAHGRRSFLRFLLSRRTWFPSVVPRLWA